MLERIAHVDRRVIYVLVGLCVSIPTFFPMPLRIEPSKPVRDVHEYLQNLPPKSLIWMPFDEWSSTRSEVQPSALAVVRQLFSLGHRIVTTSAVPDGRFISEYVLEKVAREMGKKYGEDYAILGYKTGNQIVIRQVCGGLSRAFPVDIHGTPLDAMPVTRAFHDAHSVAMVFAICDNNQLDSYAVIANTEYHLPVAGATTAVMVPILSPYVNSRQILGLLGGLRGGAEYEALTDRPGDATAGMTAQSVMHMLMIALIVVANITYFGTKKS